MRPEVNKKTSEIFNACSDLPENCDNDESNSTPDPFQLKTNILGFKRDKVLAQIIMGMEKASAPHRKS